MTDSALHESIENVLGALFTATRESHLISGLARAPARASPDPSPYVVTGGDILTSPRIPGQCNGYPCDQLFMTSLALIQGWKPINKIVASCQPLRGPLVGGTIWGVRDWFKG